MYHYIPCSAGHSGGLLYRDPADIKEELLTIRTLLLNAEERMREAEEIKEIWLATADRADAPSETLAILDAAVAECEEVRHTFLLLSERTDGLREELSETLIYLRGAVYGA